MKTIMKGKDHPTPLRLLIMKGKDYPTPLRLLIVMAVVIFSAKAIIMMFFTIIAPLSPLVEGLIDSVLITSILLPYDSQY
jgi:hypothetical protein